MKRRYNLFYFIAEAFKGLKRNGVMTFASIAVLLSCLLVIGGFSLLVLNINVNLEQLGTLNEIVVFCEPDATEDEISSVESAISSLDNIATLTHSTKSEQLAHLREESPDLYGDITDEENPLSDSFTITYKDNSGVTDLDYRLHQIEGIRKVKNTLEVATTIENLKNGVMLIFIWFLAILFVVSIFIIINTIKLTVFSRRREISIMRYIGATGWFITLPFIFEGTIIGLVSGSAAYFILKYGYIYIVNNAAAGLQMITTISFADISSLVLGAALGIGVATGVIGGSISIAKYLRD